MTVFKPCVRGSFSDRNGICKINTTIQKNNLDQRTRNNIVNLFDYLLTMCEKRSKIEACYLYIYKCIFCVTSDEIPYYNSERRKEIVSGIKIEWQYHDIFSFLESLLDWYCESIYDNNVYDMFNKMFEKECVGYRFIDRKITDIVDEIEIAEIEEALDTRFFACKKSITKALNLLYDRENPDYSNSVKESISAIESMCNIILGTNNSTLGDALNKLEKQGVKIHRAMKSAFSSLYGYTSDKSGIRHNCGVDENTTFEEAKYMLVSCSAFLNYLLQIYDSLE
ncbi:MAG: hypothetical protein IJO32_06955 [Bacilli bacterium]|nr:hypothetical protein [Bacilli bacterium]